MPPAPGTDTASRRSARILGSFRKLGRKNSSNSQRSIVTSVPGSQPSFGHKEPHEMGVLSLTHSKTTKGNETSSSHNSLSPLPTPTSATTRLDKPGMNAFTVSSGEPPPAYSTSFTSKVGPTLREPVHDVLSPEYSTDGESPYAFLATFDTTLLIDDSGSMTGRSWREVAQALSTIAPIVSQYDSDGIDVYFLNHKSADAGIAAEGVAPGGYRGIKRASTVTDIFERVRPSGGTPTGLRVHAILKPYLARLEAEIVAGREMKPLNLIVLTDGVPSDDVESVLLSAAKKLDKVEAAPYQVGVQFFQVGNEEGAKEALQALDDELSSLVEGGVRDIVDTVTWTGGAASSGNGVGLTGDGILKVVLGAVVKRLDRRRASGEVSRS